MERNDLQELRDLFQTRGWGILLGEVDKELRRVERELTVYPSRYEDVLYRQGQHQALSWLRDLKETLLEELEADALVAAAEAREAATP